MQMSVRRLAAFSSLRSFAIQPRWLGNVSIGFDRWTQLVIYYHQWPGRNFSSECTNHHCSYGTEYRMRHWIFELISAPQFRQGYRAINMVAPCSYSIISRHDSLFKVSASHAKNALSGKDLLEFLQK